MKSLKLKFLFAIIFFCFLLPLQSISQNKRQSKPKRHSKIESADTFVDITYKLYNKVYVHDSLTQVGVEIPVDLENELIESAQNDVDSLWQILPHVIDDIANSKASIISKGRATLNLNKSKKALKYCALYVKQIVVGTKEDNE
ncbi:hypothetical protein CLV33_11180 [Jejuia pallidilutea]|jgi:hypothetical protein|uniref:Uncharacterized protein n=1 Tax=Jejuia pallidilutea TaxID=504487 RepID=A0A362WXV1_9FLAO|nr:hypothetical protein [Jejuia pallidilutea]PQV46029.1 hypothetical protein CLV33_11180 [Jejuia pallidilutea]